MPIDEILSSEAVAVVSIFLCSRLPFTNEPLFRHGEIEYLEWHRSLCPFLLHYHRSAPEMVLASLVEGWLRLNFFFKITICQLCPCRLAFAAAREGHLVDVLSFVDMNRYTPSPALVFNAFLSSNIYLWQHTLFSFNLPLLIPNSYFGYSWQH